MLEVSSLKIFNIVVTHGSFSAAAEDLFMTPPAVLHRMNDLEKELGVSLFDRTAHGVTLTVPGKVLSSHAQDLIDQNNLVTKLVRESALTQQFTIRIGSSTINPASELHALWDRIIQKLPQYRLQFIPLENNNFEFPDTYNHMGERVDILFSPYGMESVRDKINFYQLGKYHFTIMMHSTDPLATKEKIDLSDLAGASLDIMSAGMTQEIDNIYRDIKKRKLKIKLVPTDAHYTVNTFNKFTESGQYLLSLDCWDNILPGLVSRPLDVPYSLPYGFITAKSPGQNIKLFMEILKESFDS